MDSSQPLQLATALSFCTALNSANVPAISLLLSDQSFTHQYLPKSLGPEAKGTRNKKETVELFEGTFEKVVMHMGIEVTRAIQGRNELMLLVHDTGKNRDGKQYDIEYIMMLRFDEESKISEIVEFQDSHYVQVEFKGWFEEALK